MNQHSRIDSRCSYKEFFCFFYLIKFLWIQRVEDSEISWIEWEIESATNTDFSCLTFFFLFELLFVSLFSDLNHPSTIVAWSQPPSPPPTSSPPPHATSSLSRDATNPRLTSTPPLDSNPNPQQSCRSHFKSSTPACHAALMPTNSASM